MPRLLFVTYVFPPMPAGGAVRTGQVARYLPEHGWDVTVLTATVGRGVAVDRVAIEALPESVDVVRAWSPNQLLGVRGRSTSRPGTGGRLLRIAVGAAKALTVPDRQITWYPAAVRRGRDLLASRPHDAVLASYGPGTSLLVGTRLAALARLPLVLDFRDLWSDLPLPVFPTPVHRALCRRLERGCVARAAALTCVSEPMASHMRRRHGLDDDRVVAVPNGYDPALRGLAREGNGGRDPTDSAPLVLLFAGAVHRFLELDPLFEALKAERVAGRCGPGRLRLEFLGNLSPELPRRFGLEDQVTCADFVGHRDAVRAMGKADALLLIEGPGYWGRFSYSAKLFDYLLTGRPVLALVAPGGNSARVLREAGVGTIVEPGDTAGIARALRRLVAEGRRSAIDIDVGRALGRAFDRRELVGRLARVLEAAVQGAGGGAGVGRPHERTADRA